MFDDGLDPDSLFDKLKEETIAAEKKPVIKASKPRKVKNQYCVCLCVCLFYISTKIKLNILIVSIIYKLKNYHRKQQNHLSG